MDERRNQHDQNNQAQQRPGQQSQGQQSQGGVSGLGDSDRAGGSGQQGSGQGASRQQQQFDGQGASQQGRQQSGGSGTTSRFADQIREHMDVIDDNGDHVGTVDHVDGDRVKLARSDSRDGQHRFVELSQVAGIEGNKVRLRERGDNDYGMET